MTMPYLTRGNHTFKFGFAVERMQSNNFMRFTENGRFVYASVPDFLTNKPLVYGVQLPSGETRARHSTNAVRRVRARRLANSDATSL